MVTPPDISSPVLMVFSPIHFQFNLNPCLWKGDSDSAGCQEVILAGTLFLSASAQFNCHCFGGSPETLLCNLSVISLFLKPQQNPEVLAKQGSSPVSISSIPKASALCRTWPFFATSPIERQIKQNSTLGPFPRWLVLKLINGETIQWQSPNSAWIEATLVPTPRPAVEHCTHCPCWCQC